MRRVAVVGGGIAGLAAAYQLASSTDDIEVVLHEAGDRVGGKLLTTPFAGRPVDEGADAFLARVPWGIELCRELGIAGDLVSPAAGSAFVWSGGALRRLPAGLVLGVPTDLDALAASGIVDRSVTPRHGARPLRADEDVAVGALVREQLGDQVLERLVDPLLGGINAGDADRLSIRAAAPQLAAAAERDADLLAALRAQPSAAPGPVFFCPALGMGALVDALLAALAGAHVDIRLGSPVRALDALDADALVIAVPADVAASLLEHEAPKAAAGLAAIEYASVALVTLAFPREGIDHALDGSGYLVPRTEGLLLTAASWATTKWAHLAGNDGRVVVRASAGRAGEERIASMDDDQLVAQLLADLELSMGARGEPDEVRVSRWPSGFPQYAPGHLDRIAQIEAELALAVPRVALAGAALRGIGVPACIREGRDAADRVLARAAGQRQG
ncbi:MAG: protoporphyrinogen/coproporphyrinogen oxidase [Acidimicrobiaceae bacterium]